jgi:transposase
MPPTRRRDGEWGLDRRAMARCGQDFATRPRAGRPTWAPLERSPDCSEWDPLDSSYRSPVARSAAPVRVVPDGASAVPELGARRSHRGSVAGRGEAPPRGWWFGFEGVFCGRNVCSGQKRGRLVGKTKRGKGTKIMGVADRHGLPLALRTESASPAEVKLVTATLDARIVADVPQQLIGDKAYDCDRLDEQLLYEYGTEMIAPNRLGRSRTQDGRSLRRYRRRWKIERLFAWLFNFRRLVVRYEYYAENFQAFVHLGAIIILLRHL